MLNLSKLYGIKGLDIEAGLGSVSHMEDIYIDILETFVIEFDDKISEIDMSYKAGNLDNFAIHIHGLKSSLKYLGASELADFASELEIASKYNDNGFLDSNLPAFIGSITELNNSIKITMD